MRNDVQNIFALAHHTSYRTSRTHGIRQSLPIIPLETTVWLYLVMSMRGGLSLSLSYSHCHQVLDEDAARVLLRRAGFASERIDDVIGAIPDAVRCMCR